MINYSCKYLCIFSIIFFEFFFEINKFICSVFIYMREGIFSKYIWAHLELGIFVNFP